MSICGHFSLAILYFGFLSYINYLGLPFFPRPPLKHHFLLADWASV